MADESHDCSEMAKVPGSSASTSSSSDRFIINTNSGKQGDVVTGVGRDFIKDVNVGGDFFKDVYVGGDFIYGEKKKLPPTPPRFVVLTAKYNGKCLRLTENDDGVFPAGFLKFDGRGRELASPEAKFELVTASTQSEHELVHIRCCHNNKYLVRSDTTCWIVAAADKPEEDESKISCTLFKLERINKSGRLEFRFHHSQRETYACFWRCWNSNHGIQFHGGLCVGMNADDAYTVVTWESLVEKMNKAVVQLPKFVALEGIGIRNNSKFLSLTTKNDPRFPPGFLQFEGQEVGSQLPKFEMKMANSENGLVHIRCCDNNKYLVRETTTRCTCCYNNNTPICTCCRDNPYWIVATGDKLEEDEYKSSCTLFELEPYDGSGEPKFRFCHVHSGMRRYACTCWFNVGLYGGSNAPDKDVCDVYRVVDLDGLG